MQYIYSHVFNSCRDRLNLHIYMHVFTALFMLVQFCILICIKM